MPHLIVEYSANIESEIVLDELLDKLRDSALAAKIFPIGGLRVRAQRTDHYRVADCDPANGFVHMTVFVGHGRPLDVLERAGQQLFDTLTTHLDELYRQGQLAISLNMQEFHPQLNFKKNNLHRYLSAKRANTDSADE